MAKLHTTVIPYIEIITLRLRPMETVIGYRAHSSTVKDERRCRMFPRNCGLVDQFRANNVVENCLSLTPVATITKLFCFQHK